MVKKNTLILLIVAVVLVGAYFLLKSQDKLNFRSSSAEPTATPLPKFISLDSASIMSIKLSRPETDDLLIIKDSSGNWQINVPDAIVTAGNVEEIVSEFNAIQTEQLLSLDLDLTSIGLDNPQFTFTFNLNDGTQKVVKIGNANPLNTDYYAQLDAGAPVLISQGSINNIISVFESAATPPTPTPAPTSTNG